jgi:uncharacterized protein (DUF433 family)
MSLPLTAHLPPLRYDGSTLRVGRSNVTLENVLWAFQQGATPEQIVDRYPTLALADVYDVVAYYLRDRPSVEAYLAEQERAAEELADAVRRESPSRVTRAELERRLALR